jgi:hypothetical protein
LGRKDLSKVIWKRQTAKGDVTQGARHMERIHETILLYTKSDNYIWNVQHTPYDQSYIDDFYAQRDIPFILSMRLRSSVGLAENTIREAKVKSHKKIYLGDSETDETLSSFTKARG